MTKILIVDDEPLLLDSLEIILKISGGYDVVGKATNGIEALPYFAKEQIDILLVDLNMPKMGGIELISRVHASYPEVKILVLTTFYDEKSIASAIAGGATSYLLKDSGKDQILRSIKEVISGRSVLDQKVMEKLTQMLVATNTTSAQARTRASVIEENAEQSSGAFPSATSKAALCLDALTTREKEICRLISDGLTNRQIASVLFFSEGTVKNYISSIYDKLDIHDRAMLVAKLRDL